MKIKTGKVDPDHIPTNCKGVKWCDCTNPMFLLVDNSDSPSVVEQLQQGCGSNCYTFY